jgi:poly(3-hydroxybutyrate) depolymerase
VGGLAGVDPTGSECAIPSGKAPRVLSIHETGDPQVSYTGGGDEYLGAEDLAAVMAAKQGCSSATRRGYTKGNVSCRDYDCPDGAASTLCSIDDDKHTWPPGNSDDPAEIGTRDLDTNEYMWAFFEGLPVTSAAAGVANVLLAFLAAIVSTNNYL